MRRKHHTNRAPLWQICSNVASLASPKRKNGAPPLDAPDALYAPAPPVVSATQPKRSLRELAARAGAEGPKRGNPRRFPDPVLEARICRGSPPLASARQLVPGDPGSLTLSPSAAGQDKRAKFPTSKAHISAVFHSFWLILGRAIISRNGLEA